MFDLHKSHLAQCIYTLRAWSFFPVFLWSQNLILLLLAVECARKKKKKGLKYREKQDIGSSLALCKERNCIFSFTNEHIEERLYEQVTVKGYFSEQSNQLLFNK